MQETTTTPTNDDIEAVIQMATQAAQNDPRSLPLRDTRTQLFVANLPYRVRWQDLKDLFRRAGTVLRADVSLGPDNRSRGYGTVLLATAEDAGRAVDMFSGYSWQGRILEVRADRVRDFDQPFPEVEEEFAQSGRNLFVGNLPFHVQWQDLKDLFRQAGTIVRADVALGPDGRSRGFGTVVFATEKDARRAVGMFSGYEYNGRTLKVHYDKFSQGTQMPFDLGLLSSTASPFDMSASTSFDLTGLTAEYANDVFAMPHPHHHLQSRLLDFHNPTPPPIQSLQLQQPPQLHQQQRSPTAQASLAQLQSQLQQLQLDAHSPSSSQTHSPPSLGSSQQQQQDTRPSTSEAQAQTAGTSPGSSYAHAAKRSPTSPNQHPHHPGPIALPPPPALAPSAPLANGYAVPSANQNSNNNNNGAPPNPMHPNGAPAGPNPFAPPAYALTPLGLPPITPSMPPFSFLPMPSPGSVHPQQAQGYFTMSGMGTPTHAHFMNMTPLATPTSPHFPAYIMNGAPPGPPNGMGGGAGMGMVVGMGMGPPSALSPGAFWGRAGEGSVYGAPVGQPPAHPHAHSPYAHLVAGGSPGFFGMHPMGTGAVQMEEPKGYFDFPPAFGTGPPVGGGGAAGVEKEIMKGEEERKEDAERERASGPPEEPSSPEQEPALPSVKEPAPESEARLRRHSHSSDAPPPPSPMREGKRPPPLRLPSATGSD